MKYDKAKYFLIPNSLCEICKKTIGVIWRKYFQKSKKTHGFRHWVMISQLSTSSYLSELRC